MARLRLCKVNFRFGTPASASSFLASSRDFLMSFEKPRKLGMNAVMSMRMDMPGELSEPMNPMAAADYLNNKDGYEVTEADERMLATGQGQLFGQFLLDRQGIVRWSFTEVPEGGHRMFGRPSPQELISAASQVAG